MRKQLSESDLLNDLAQQLHGVHVPVVVIGDSAFKLSRFLMKPYPYHVTQNKEQKTFNYALSKCRRVVENAFGHLKARFRRIGKGIDNSIENAPLIIKVCCVLHNILNDCNDIINSTWLHEIDTISLNQPQPPQRLSMYDCDENGIQIRDAIAKYLGEYSQSFIRMKGIWIVGSVSIHFTATQIEYLL